jgi:hypothetical protein
MWPVAVPLRLLAHVNPARVRPAERRTSRRIAVTQQIAGMDNRRYPLVAHYVAQVIVLECLQVLTLDLFADGELEWLQRSDICR